MTKNITLSILFFASFVLGSSPLMEPTSLSKNLYKLKILDGIYSKNISHPNEFLDFEYGDRVASPSQITNAIKSWSEQTDKIHVIEYARSHENRPLHAIFISSSKNINNLDNIKEKQRLLSDARNLNDREAKKIIDSLPAIAWMAYSIHGNETSGADAALGILYHLIASEDEDTIKLLDNMIIIIDPLMNPDGRARFVRSLEQYRGTSPNYDDQSLLHTGEWPYGRTNHYYYDLNRDWYYLTQPETIGRVKLINEWKPQILVDAHEMFSQDTFMTSPPREPINKNIDTDIIKWGNIFAKDQGEEFDKRNWRYYTGEWHEDLYPGYSFYVQFRGTLGILYEQSRMAEDGVKRPEGTIQSYKESVHHQYVSTLINLKTLKNNSKSMYLDYWEGRKYNVSKDSQYSNQSFVILPTKNLERVNTLAEKLQIQGIELFKNESPIYVNNVLKQNGEYEEEFTIPSNSLIIPNRQPEAPLIAAILEFDADIDQEVLIKERQARLRDGSSIMYDTTAFNFSMMYGLSAITVPQNISSNLTKWEAEDSITKIDEDAIMWAADGDDDRSVALAARLMELGLQVRIIDKESNFSGHNLSRGSVVVIAMDNPENESIVEIISVESQRLGLPIKSLNTGFGPDELPDWGGEHFRLLKKPQVAIISHEGFNSYDVGVSWWSIDHHLGIRHSHINKSIISYADLRRYNTIILPSGSQLNETVIKTLSDWIKQGGTLIAHNRSSRFLASEKGIGSVHQIQDSFEKSNELNIDYLKEIFSLDTNINKDDINKIKLDEEIIYPWENANNKLSSDELTSRDKWQSQFMPSGSFLSGRSDQKHWLTFGTNETLPLLYANYPILMTHGSSEAVIRVGELIDTKSNKEARYINWSSIPAGKDLNVRMSGLVWPEASQRIANSAYLTRQKFGKGQIILFSGEPNFRGSTLGTNRLWLNAVVYGSGLGTNSKINL